jgi:3',5'-cyclic AMP phosphodiesterase CpdA
MEMSRIRIVHFSDMHLWSWGLDWPDVPLKRWLGLGNLALRRARQFPYWLAEQVVAEMVKVEADACVFTGDLTTCALGRELDMAVVLLSPLRERWGDDLMIMPGNHDRYTRKVVAAQRFESCLLPGREQAPWRLDLSSGFTLVGLDCSAPRMMSSRGRFTAEQARQSETALEQVKKEGRRLVLCGHYPYSYPEDFRIKWSHLLPRQDRQRLTNLVRWSQPAAYLHGHEHHRWVHASPLETPLVPCVNAGSAGCLKSKPHSRAGFLVLEFSTTPRLEQVRSYIAPVEAGQPFDQSLLWKHD